MCGLIFRKDPSTGLHMKYHMPWIGFMNDMSHYYLGGGGGRGSSDYYRAYLGDIIWSISLILCNKIYARVAQYYILRPFEI